MNVSPTSDFGLETSAARELIARLGEDAIDLRTFEDELSIKTFDALVIDIAPGDIASRLGQAASLIDRLLSLQRWQPMETARRWRHKKSGTTYTEMGRGLSWVSDVFGVYSDKNVVVFRADLDGRIWRIPVAHFEDGRFEPLPIPPTQKGGGSDGPIHSSADDTTQPRPSDDQAGGARKTYSIAEQLAWLAADPGGRHTEAEKTIFRNAAILIDNVSELHSSGIQEGLERAAKMLDAKATMLRDNAAALGSDHLLVLAGQVEADAAAIRASGDRR